MSTKQKPKSPFPHRACSFGDFRALSAADQRELETLYDRQLRLEQMVHKVSLCGGNEATARRLLAYLRMNVDDLGIPQELWDECSDVGKVDFLGEINAMPTDVRTQFVSSLVVSLLEANRIVGSDEPVGPEVARRASEREGGTTTIGTMLAMRRVVEAVKKT